MLQNPCEWALIYNSMPTLNGNNFSVISEQFANTITDAQTYLADAIAANEPQDAYFLNLTPSDPKGDSQGMMSTDLLNFTESPVGITTQASPSGNAVALGTSLSDTATLSGAYQTGGSIQFALKRRMEPRPMSVALFPSPAVRQPTPRQPSPPRRKWVRTRGRRRTRALAVTASRLIPARMSR